MARKLILSPHIDDEVLGCGGILDEDTFVLYCGVENRYINGDMSISVVTTGLLFYIAVVLPYLLFYSFVGDQFSNLLDIRTFEIRNFLSKEFIFIIKVIHQRQNKLIFLSLINI